MNLVNSLLAKLDVFLDTFFAKQAIVFEKLLKTLFSYTYRETRLGIFGLFDTPAQIRKVAIEAKRRGYTNFDCLTPFPIHGLEFDMGLTRSRLPYITLFAGGIGLLIGFFLQFIVHEQVIGVIFPYFNDFPNFRSYPLNIGGKPTFSWPAMVPICFELTILLGGLLTVLGLILVARMYSPFRPVLHPDITKDKFCLWLPSDSQNYNEESAYSFLNEFGARYIEILKEK